MTMTKASSCPFFSQRCFANKTSNIPFLAEIPNGLVFYRPPLLLVNQVVGWELQRGTSWRGNPKMGSVSSTFYAHVFRITISSSIPRLQFLAICRNWMTLPVIPWWLRATRIGRVWQIDGDGEKNPIPWDWKIAQNWSPDARCWWFSLTTLTGLEQNALKDHPLPLHRELVIGTGLLRPDRNPINGVKSIIMANLLWQEKYTVAERILFLLLLQFPSLLHASIRIFVMRFLAFSTTYKCFLYYIRRELPFLRRRRPNPIHLLRVGFLSRAFCWLATLSSPSFAMAFCNNWHSGRFCTTGPFPNRLPRCVWWIIILLLEYYRVVWRKGNGKWFSFSVAVGRKESQLDHNNCCGWTGAVEIHTWAHGSITEVTVSVGRFRVVNWIMNWRRKKK